MTSFKDIPTVKYIYAEVIGNKHKMQLFAILALHTRSSADAEGLHDTPQIQNITLKKACNRGMTFKDSRSSQLLLLDRPYTSITSC